MLLTMSAITLNVATTRSLSAAAAATGDRLIKLVASITSMTRKNCCMDGLLILQVCTTSAPAASEHKKPWKAFGYRWQDRQAPAPKPCRQGRGLYSTVWLM